MSENNTNSEWQNREVASLWLNKSQSGREYYNGKMAITVNGKKVEKDIVAFPHVAENADDRKPNLKVYLSVPKDGNGSNNNSQSSDVDL